MSETKKSNKREILGIVLVIMIAATNLFLRPKMLGEVKSITIEVRGDEKESVLYEFRTDEEYLLQAMEEVEGLEFSDFENTIEGDLPIYGTVNGETASEEKGTCWIVSISGFLFSGDLSKRPIKDGDDIEIIYTHMTNTK